MAKKKDEEKPVFLPNRKLTDPGEMELLREIYFEDHKVANSDLDPEERLERFNTRSKQTNNPAR